MPDKHNDNRVLARDRCVVRYVLERHAEERPDKVFIAFPDGREITYRELRDLVVSTASALQGLGVRQDGFVMSWLPNGLDIIRVFLAANYLGAVHVPINTAYRGNLLEHVIRNSGATVMVAHADLTDRLNDVELSELEHLISVGGPSKCSAKGLNCLDASGLDGPAPTLMPEPPRTIEPWDIQSIIYTSGTTGPSKGVLSSYFHLLSMGEATCYYAGADDRSLCYLPFFHAASLAGFMKMLCDGGSIGLVEAFDTTRFWADINATKSTTCMMLGAVATFLSKAGQSEEEKKTTCKTILGAPFNADVKEIGRRSQHQYICVLEYDGNVDPHHQRSESGQARNLWDCPGGRHRPAGRRK